MIRNANHLRHRLLPLLLPVFAVTGCSSLGDTGSSQAMAPLDASAKAPPIAGETSGTPAVKAESGGTSEPAKRETVRMYKGNGVLLNPVPPQPTKTSPGSVSFNFEGADIRDVAKTVLADILKESYVVDPKVTGTISFRTTSPLPPESVLPTLETILRMNGIVMIKENGIFKIMPGTMAKGSLSPRLGGSVAGYSVQVVPLKFVSATEMTKLLEPFSPDPAAIKADELRNLLILSGTQNEIQHMMDTINLFDVDWLSGMSIGLFTLQSADVKSVAGEISKVFGDKNLNPFAGMVRIVPLERLNAFVIITPQPQYLEQARTWLERLDKAGGSSGSRLHVYHVQNGKAEHLADLLNQTFASLGQAASSARTPAPSVAPGLASTEVKSSSPFGTSTGGTGGFGNTTLPQAAQGSTTGSTLSVTDDSGAASQVRVVADRENNALLILASAAGYDKVESALRKLDVAPREVLIEVTVAEVSLSGDLSYGIEWALTSGSRKSFQLDTGAAGISKLVPGFSYALTNVTGDAIKAVFNTLATDDRLNVLSSPHIMVADNQTAKIQVGDSVPIQTSQTTALANVATNGTITSSVQYVDTGVMLAVTPHINAGGLVNLEVAQEVSTAKKTSTSGLDSPTISKRSAKTIVTVQSGETMVLGGLISEQTDAGSAGIPYLVDIPILGAAFGKKTRTTNKTELVLLITPRVANNLTQGKEISDELRQRMGEAQRLIDCGTSNELGWTTRGGPWCLQARRFDGATDKMMKEDAAGNSVYLKDEAKLEQQAAQRELDEATRKQRAARERLNEASQKVKATETASKGKAEQAPPPSPKEASGPRPATESAPSAK